MFLGVSFNLINLCENDSADLTLFRERKILAESFAGETSIKKPIPQTFNTIERPLHLWFCKISKYS